MTVLVIGLGNEARRDDGIGVAVASEIAERRISGVDVLITAGDPGELLGAWGDVPIVIAVDAVLDCHASPGAIRRWTPTDMPTGATGVSSHAFGLLQTYRLAEALGRLPAQLIIFTVGVADVGHGFEMTQAVARAVPDVVTAIIDEVSDCDERRADASGDRSV